MIKNSPFMLCQNASNYVQLCSWCVPIMLMQQMCPPRCSHQQNCAADPSFRVQCMILSKQASPKGGVRHETSLMSRKAHLTALYPCVLRKHLARSTFAFQLFPIMLALQSYRLFQKYQLHPYQTPLVRRGSGDIRLISWASFNIHSLLYAQLQTDK